MTALHATPWSAASEAIREAREGHVSAEIIRVVFDGPGRGFSWTEAMKDEPVRLSAEEQLQAVRLTLSWCADNADSLRAYRAEQKRRADA